MTDAGRGGPAGALILLLAALGGGAPAGPALAQGAAAPEAGERARQAFGGGAPEAGAAETEAEEAARAAAAGLGVEVLGSRMLEVQGRQLMAVRVMAPGGNSNAAFLVQTLMVDPASGEILGVFPGTEAELPDLPPLPGETGAPSGEASPPGSGSD